MFFKIELESYALKIAYLAAISSYVFLQKQSFLLLPRSEWNIWGDQQSNPRPLFLPPASSYSMFWGMKKFCPLMAVFAHDGCGMGPYFVWSLILSFLCLSRKNK